MTCLEGSTLTNMVLASSQICVVGVFIRRLRPRLLRFAPREQARRLTTHYVRCVEPSRLCLQPEAARIAYEGSALINAWDIDEEIRHRTRSVAKLHELLIKS